MKQERANSHSANRAECPGHSKGASRHATHAECRALWCGSARQSLEGAPDEHRELAALSERPRPTLVGGSNVSAAKRVRITTAQNATTPTPGSIGAHEPGPGHDHRRHDQPGAPADQSRHPAERGITAGPLRGSKGPPRCGRLGATSGSGMIDDFDFIGYGAKRSIRSCGATIKQHLGS